MQMNGFIKLHRRLTEWEWYTDANTMRVWVHCLLKANWEDKKFQGQPVPRGTFITSYAHIAKELKISVDQARTALKHLEMSGNITRKSTNKYQAITVENYALFQDVPQANTKQENNQIPIKSQSNPNQIPTTEEIKNIRNKEIKNNRANSRFAPPSLEEVKAYCKERGNNINPEAFINFYESKGWMVGKNKMKDWKAAIRTWEQKEQPKKQEQGNIYDLLGKIKTGEVQVS